MQTITPLQLDIRTNVFEHDRRFYCAVSATLATHLLGGEVVMPFDYLSGLPEGSDGEMPLDTGMPKPQGEYLVTGSFHAPKGQPVPAGEVALAVGALQKRLAIFGERRWQGPVPGPPTPFTTLPLTYAHAFGGKDFARNTGGMGHKDGLLPRIEHPGRLVGGRDEEPEPAGVGAMGMDWPQRSQYRGTYDGQYLRNYYPGHPADFDWRFFLTAPPDQRLQGFWQGNERYALHNLHRHQTTIEGQLPGYRARCFLQRTGAEAGFAELPLRLDTLWFFPGQLLALQIWRGVLEVVDDEAAQISHLLAGYEDAAHQPRDVGHYRQALALRLTTRDPLRNSLNTADLIPEGAPCAMEILQQRAFADSEQSPLVANIEAKVAELRKMADEKIEEALQQVEQQVAAIDTPGMEPVDIRALAQAARQGEADPAQRALTDKLEAILPGITGGDPKQIELKEFSFDKIDQMMQVVRDFADDKEQEGKRLAKEEIAKAQETLAAQLAAGTPGEAGIGADERARLEQEMRKLADLDFDHPAPGPLPRVDAEALMGQLAPIDPMMQEAMQHVASMRATGSEEAQIAELERRIGEMYDGRMTEIEQRLREAEGHFKEAYILGAHFMAEGLPPHKESLDEVRARFLRAVAAKERVSGCDWACLDLAGQNLDGIDLSDCFLEQVNFTGASLKGATLARAILARAVLTDADLSGANLHGANIGAVFAHGANCSGADLHGAKLSKGDFTRANFTGANLEEVEALDIVVAAAVFDQARLAGVQFIERQLTGVRFCGAGLATALFYKCTVRDADFSAAAMPHSVWADCSLETVRFDGADLSAACFVATEEGKSILRGVHFPGARLDRGTFQHMGMAGTDLAGASMEGTLFNGSDLSGADLRDAAARQAQFRKTDLNGARLDRIDLREGSLAKARLTNASLTGANLYAVDCLRCTIGNTNFSGANLDATLLEDGSGQ